MNAQQILILKWAAGLAALTLMAVCVVQTIQPDPEDVLGQIVVFTDAVVGSDAPQECLDFNGTKVSVRDEEGVPLWTGEAYFGAANIRIPDLGCSIEFTTEPLPRRDAYVFEAEGLETQTLTYDELEEDYHIVTWHVCLESQRPCDLADGS